jgi:DNA-binding NarL/FixJ family response regulator
MKPGDRVRAPGGTVARVLEVLEDGRLVLDTPDGPRRYSQKSVRAIGPTKGPLAVACVGERELEAARLVAMGLPRTEVARRLGTTTGVVSEYLSRVREAAEDAANLAVLRYGA